MSAVAATPADTPPALALWLREAECVVSGAGGLSDAARAMVRTVLVALAADPATDAAGLRDVERMLAASDPEPARVYALPVS